MVDWGTGPPNPIRPQMEDLGLTVDVLLLWTDRYRRFNPLIRPPSRNVRPKDGCYSLWLCLCSLLCSAFLFPLHELQWFSSVWLYFKIAFDFCRIINKNRDFLLKGSAAIRIIMYIKFVYISWVIGPHFFRTHNTKTLVRIVQPK